MRPPSVERAGGPRGHVPFARYLPWQLLLWVCLALFVFAISRSAGHLLKQIFLLSDRQARPVVSPVEAVPEPAAPAEDDAETKAA